MKKLFDDDEYDRMEKSRILVTLIPVLLIILILAGMLAVKGLQKTGEESGDLQQSIMDYADENQDPRPSDDIREANSSSVTAKEQTTPEKEESQDEEEENQAPIPSPTPYREVMGKGKKDYSKIAFHQEEQLRDMMAYWEDNNQKALDDLAYLDHYIAMSFSLKGTTDCYYYGGKDGNGRPSGKGIAVYADNQYYYGDWKDGVRSGNGTWIHYHIHLEENTNDLYTYHQYTGGWAGDLPDGEGSEHYDYNMELLKGNDGYDANLIGSYASGLVNGEFYITNIYADGSSREWNAQADHGSWIYQNENKDKKGNRTVYIDINDPDNYVWMHPRKNVNIRIPCLISKNW